MKRWVTFVESFESKRRNLNARRGLTSLDSGERRRSIVWSHGRQRLRRQRAFVFAWLAAAPDSRLFLSTG